MANPADDETDALLRELIPGLDDEGSEWDGSPLSSGGEPTLQLPPVPGPLAKDPVSPEGEGYPADVGVVAPVEQAHVDYPQVEELPVVDAPDWEPQDEQPHYEQPYYEEPDHERAGVGGPGYDEPYYESSFVAEPLHQEHYEEEAPYIHELQASPRRRRALVAVLAAAVVLVGLIAGFAWLQARDDTTAELADESATGAPEAPTDEADPAGEPTAPEDEAGALTAGSISPGDAGVDPATGESYPSFLDLFTIDDFTDRDYPRGSLSVDGTVTLQGRMGTQEEIDQAVADTEALIGAGKVVNEFTLTPGFPAYDTWLIFLDDVVLFETNSIEIDAAYGPYLDGVTGLLATFPTMRITAVGYADSVGAQQSNLQISRDRAQSVFSYWTDRGVSVVQLSTEARGETGGSEAEIEEPSARDRRVEFVVDFGG